MTHFIFPQKKIKKEQKKLHRKKTGQVTQANELLSQALFSLRLILFKRQVSVFCKEKRQ
jgi:hypothetical protein